MPDRLHLSAGINSLAKTTTKMKIKNDYIVLAKKLGSSSKTFAGAKKFILGQRGVFYYGTFGYKWENCDARQAYVVAEKIRTSSPEAKRASADNIFRAKYLRRLNAEAKKINRQPETLGEISQFISSAVTRQNRLQEISKLISIAKNKPATPIMTAQYTGPAKIMLPGFSAKFPSCAAESAKLGYAVESNVRWIFSHGFCNRILANQNSISAKGRNGWYSTQHADHRAEIRCAGLIISDQKLQIAYCAKEFFVELPENYSWQIDQHGIKAVCGPDDFHPTISDCLEGAEFICEKIQANKVTREKLAAQKLAEMAEMEGVSVCVADSLRAGNCLAGTQSFAVRHQLDLNRHYSAPEILKIANGDESRVRLCIRAAIIQNNVDVQRGYSILAEHKLSVA